MVFDFGSDLAHEIHEVLLDHTDDVEAIGDDPGVGEVTTDQGTVGAAQIHADDTDVFFAVEPTEVSVEILWIPAFDDIENAVGPEVAEGRGEPGSPSMPGSFPVDGVFIDTEDGRTDAIGTFPGFLLGVFAVEAFDSSRADPFPMSEDAAGNTVAMALVDGLPKRFGGLAIGFDAGESRDK